MRTVEPGSQDTPALSAPGLTSNPRRPFGLYMILILLSLQALLGVFVTLTLGISMVIGGDNVLQVLLAEVGQVAETIGSMFVAGVVAVGLWRYRLWAWLWMMLLLAYWMATDAIGYFSGEPQYFSMLLNVAMVFYLNQREVKVLFEK